MPDEPKPYDEVPPSTRKRNVILGVVLAAVAVFMYFSIFARLS